MTFQEDLLELHSNNKTPKEVSLDFPQYRGLSFKEYWEILPAGLTYFDYEEELHNILEYPEEYPEEQQKHLWIKKATGLGISEFMIRYISWKCLKDDDWKNRQIDVNVVFIVGPRVELAITIMNRMKNLFGDHDFKTKETVLTLNGNRIEVFPSHHLSPARGLNPQFVFLDEADFFPPQMQIEARMVSERYIAKTDPYICMVSTPNLPLGLFDQMEREEESIYIRKHMGYEVGLGKVFTTQAIEKAKQSPSFEREYNLKYGYGLGNIFSGIDEVIEDYDLTPTPYGSKGVYADPAFGNVQGSSNFGLCAGEVLDGILYTKVAREFDRSSPSAMLDILEEIAHKFDDNCKVDAAHPGFIRDLNERGLPAIPVSFGIPVRDTESDNVQSLRSKMTINASMMVANKEVRVHKSQPELIAQMRAASFDTKGGIDKKELNADVLDAFIMMCYDLKEHDYASTGIRHDGTIYGQEKEKSKSVRVRTEVVE